MSATVLKTHEDRLFPGAIVASLSTPWGNRTNTLGGYHLVWPRDATLAAFALLAAKEVGDAQRVLAHMMAVQQPDGHWTQNYFPTGQPFWTGIQLDETGFPVLLAAKLREGGHPDLPGVSGMVRRAIGSIAFHGPSSEQDRWEENPGISAFTVAVAISALVAAAPWLDGPERDYALDLADDWNERIEQWCFVAGTPMAETMGIPGYYVRIAPPEKDGGLTGRVMLRNRNGETIAASCLVALDFSWLVRLGLRKATDPRVLDTIKVVNSVPRVATPSGPSIGGTTMTATASTTTAGRTMATESGGPGRCWSRRTRPPRPAGRRGPDRVPAHDAPLRQPRRSPARAGVGCRADPGGLPVSGTPVRQRHAAGLVARRVPQAADRPQRRKAGGTARGVGGSLRQRNARRQIHALAQRDAGPVPRDRPDASDRGSRGLHPSSRSGRLAGRRGPGIPAAPFGLWGVALDADRYRAPGTLNFTRRYGDRWEGQDHTVELAEAPRPRTLVHHGGDRPADRPGIDQHEHVAVGVADGNGSPAVRQGHDAVRDDPTPSARSRADERVEIVDRVNLASGGDVVGLEPLGRDPAARLSIVQQLDVRCRHLGRCERDDIDLAPCQSVEPVLFRPAVQRAAAERKPSRPT